MKLLLDTKKQFNYLLYCYVLMGNHFHITIETPDSAPISKIMQLAEGSYATYFNKRHNGAGHLFQGRFNDIIVEKDSYLLELSRYVHLNPVRAGYVRRPEEYKWSSYNIYMGNKDDKLVDTKAILRYFKTQDRKDAQLGYRDFVEDGMKKEKEGEDWLKGHLVKRRFLGSANFINTIKQISKKGV